MIVSAGRISHMATLAYKSKLHCNRLLLCGCFCDLGHSRRRAIGKCCRQSCKHNVVTRSRLVATVHIGRSRLTRGSGPSHRLVPDASCPCRPLGLSKLAPLLFLT